MIKKSSGLLHELVFQLFETELQVRRMTGPILNLLVDGAEPLLNLPFMEAFQLLLCLEET